MKVEFSSDEVADIMKRHLIWLAEKNVKEETITVYDTEGMEVKPIVIEADECS